MPFFPGKFIFAQIRAKRARNGPKVVFFGFLNNFVIIVIDILPPIPYLAKFWFLSYGPKCCQSIKLQDSLKCNILRKKWMMKYIFDMRINIKVFYRLMLSFWVFVTRHAQSTQNKEFAYISLHYLQKSIEDEVYFLPANKHESFLQDDSITLGVRKQACP